MASENETVADIIAEMCGGPIPQHRRDQELLRHFAGRIEVAHRRERAAIEADALAVGGLVEASRKRKLLFTITRETDNSGAVIYTNDNSGDAAKLREALVNISKYADCAAMRQHDTHTQHYIEQIRKWANAALAAPPRNCDVGTADEQAERYGRYCDKFTQNGMHCETCPCCGKIKFGRCEFAWAQMPYEKGGANE